MGLYNQTITVALLTCIVAFLFPYEKKKKKRMCANRCVYLDIVTSCEKKQH